MSEIQFRVIIFFCSQLLIYLSGRLVREVSDEGSGFVEVGGFRLR
ncbi:hypothetical protein LY11_03151 [Pedobacter cryoconitis]|uniref:Uncharacterized protein n=1 Tax=Pedobacter cryoconitis TaxID=188932 RepID=A0A327ST96_9SPHI|nr:hypothetical protein LY11_03151 [Pedobacter cryoconitis]